MKVLKSLFLLWCTVLALFISISGIMAIQDASQLIFQMAFIPVTLYLAGALLSHLLTKSPAFDKKRGWRRLATYYCFLVSTTVVAVGFMSASSLPQLVSAAIFSPLAIYFAILAWPRSGHAIHLPRVALAKSEKPELIAKPIPPGKIDIDRRMFLKLIGSAGISVFIFSLFTKRAEAAFFGSGPGNGPVSLKDASGNKIDPAEKYPTDGYNITELDDSTPAYYGFVNKTGAWFIMKEDSTATPYYSYTKGNNNFTNATTGWPNRANLTYDYFDNVF